MAPEHSSHRPDLTEAEVAELPAQYYDVPRDSVRYGEALPVVVQREMPWRSWLEAAVRAGWVPHQEGIELAERAVFVWVRARVAESLTAGADGDAEGWLSGFAEAYRLFADCLLREAEQLERWRGRLLPPDA